MMEPVIEVGDGITVLPKHFPIPGMGFLPVNSFVLQGSEPILIDTGIAIEREEFLATLGSVVEPRDLRWIVLTHDDVDHTGSLEALLQLAPNAQLVAHPLAALRQTTAFAVPMNRVRFLNPGEALTTGDRTLKALRPPIFDNPSTIGLYDEKTRALFSADCFGGILESLPDDAADVPSEALAQGMAGWAAADAPWLHLVDQRKLSDAFKVITDMAPSAILSAHLPPAKGMEKTFVEILAGVPDGPPFKGPTQADLEAMLGGG